MIERIVLEELEKIFSGKRSHIFTHRGEQLIKEMSAKNKQGWKEWMKDSANPNQHKTKVCSKVSNQESSGSLWSNSHNAEICRPNTSSLNIRSNQPNTDIRNSSRNTFSRYNDIDR